MNQRVSNGILIAATAFLVVAISWAAWAGEPLTASNLGNLLTLSLPLAGIYAMSAAGLVVVYTTTGIFNFAQGAIGMFLAYVYWELKVNRNMPTALAVVLTVFVAAPAIGVFLDRVIMRHLVGRSLVVQLTVTIGLMFAFIGLSNMLWDPAAGYSVPHFFGDSGFHIGEILITWHRFTTLIAALVLVVGLRTLLYGTRTGIAMRAVVDNRGLAALAGARSDVLSSLAWALGCMLAAVAGILYAPETDMSRSGPLTLLIITAFSAAVVGRLRSLPMTYLGAIILALLSTWSEQFLSFGGRWNGMRLAIPTLMLFVVLLLIPSAQLRYSRIRVTKHVERVSTVRDTVLGMAVLWVCVALSTTFLSEVDLRHVILGVCIALVALSLVPLIGWAGQVSLAPLAFAGIGAVAYIRLGGADGHWYAIFLAALVTAPVGALMALPALRLQGLYLALATVAFASAVDALFFIQPFALGTGGHSAERMSLFGYQFESTTSFLLLVTAVFGMCGVLTIALRRSAFGRRLIAMRDSEAASATIGVNILETKVAVFALSAAMAGFAGAFMAQYYGTLSTNDFAMLQGLAVVLSLAIGGVAYVAGALFAGLFGLGLILIQEYWHLSLWSQLVYLAPGLAALGIIQNPSGAVVAIGDGFAPLLPWRKDAKLRADAVRAAEAEPEVGDLGLERPFTENDVLIVDRSLGITADLPRAAPNSGNGGARVASAPQGA